MFRLPAYYYKNSYISWLLPSLHPLREVLLVLLDMLPPGLEVLKILVE